MPPAAPSSASSSASVQALLHLVENNDSIQLQYRLKQQARAAREKKRPLPSASSSPHSTGEETLPPIQPIPSVPSMVDCGDRVPSLLSHSWHPLKQDSSEKLSFYLTVIRVPGVFCERHVGLLTREPFPSPITEHLPPLFIYPHGIRQCQVELVDSTPVELSQQELELAENFHVAAMRIVTQASPRAPAEAQPKAEKLADNKKPLFPTFEGLIPPKEPLPFPFDFSTADLAYRSSTARSSHYLLVLCGLKSDEELRGERWRLPEERDEHFMTHEEVQQELQWQWQERESRTEGGDGSSQRPISQPALHSPHTSPVCACLSIDLLAMYHFLGRPTLLNSSRGRPLKDRSILTWPWREDRPHSHTSQRDRVYYTPYNGRFYTNLSQPHLSEDLTSCAWGEEDRPGSESHPTGLSPFPDRTYSSYADYYEKRWGLTLKDPGAKLLRVTNLNFHAINVLQPALLQGKKKAKAQSGEAAYPQLVLPPEAVQWFQELDINLLFLLRLMPCILQRIETDLLQWELRQSLKATQIIPPYVMRMALTTANAQEAYPLPRIHRSLHAAESTIPPLNCPSLPALPFALTSNTLCYDRLKFVGDSLLKLSLVKVLLLDYPDASEEEITRWKGALLHMNRLASLAIKHKLQRYVSAHPSQLALYRPPGMWEEEGSKDSAATSSSTTSSLSLVPSPPSQVSSHVLADVVSSLVGAAWIGGREFGVLQLMSEWGILPPVRVPSPLFPTLSALQYWTQLQEFARCASTATLDDWILHPFIDFLTQMQVKCEEIIGYQFQTQALFVQALISKEEMEELNGWREQQEEGASSGHASSPSFPPLSSYERVELLGDSVLELLSSTFLTSSLLHWPGRPRDVGAGDLTFLRQKMVNNQMLADSVKKGPMGPLIARKTMQGSGHSLSSPPDSLSALPPKALADLVESLLGAVYVDSHFQLSSVWTVYTRIVDVEAILLRQWERMKLG